MQRAFRSDSRPYHRDIHIHRPGPGPGISAKAPIVDGPGSAVGMQLRVDGIRPLAYLARSACSDGV